LDYRDQFNNDEFRTLLHQFEEAEAEGRLATFGSDELTDIAEYYHSIGDFDKAIEVVDKAIEIYPGALSPLVFRARAALMRDDDANQALYYAEQIDDKNDLDFFYIYAEILVAQYKAAEANDYLTERYEEIDEEEQQDFILDVATLFADYEYWDFAESWTSQYEDSEAIDYLELQGRITIANGEYVKSENIYNTLIDSDSFCTTYWNQLALAQLYGGKVAESIQSSEYSLAINPDDSDALLIKSSGLYLLGNYDEAVVYFTRYMKSRGQEIPDDFDINNYIKKLNP